MGGMGMYSCPCVLNAEDTGMSTCPCHPELTKQRTNDVPEPNPVRTRGDGGRGADRHPSAEQAQGGARAVGGDAVLARQRRAEPAADSDGGHPAAAATVP